MGAIPRNENSGLAWVTCLGAPPVGASPRDGIEPMDLEVTYSVVLDGCSAGSPSMTAEDAVYRASGIPLPTGDIRCNVAPRMYDASGVDSASAALGVYRDRMGSDAVMVGRVASRCSGCVRYGTMMQMDMVGQGMAGSRALGIGSSGDTQPVLGGVGVKPGAVSVDDIAAAIESSRSSDTPLILGSPQVEGLGVFLNQTADSDAVSGVDLTAGIQAAIGHRIDYTGTVEWG